MNATRIALGILVATLMAAAAFAQEKSAPAAMTVAGQGTAPAKETRPPRIRVPADVQDKNVVHRVFAIYPPVSSKIMTGTVGLHVIIAADGTVQKAEYVSGPAYCANSAKTAVEQWKYKPSVLNGQPVEIETTVNVVCDPFQDRQPPSVLPPAAPPAKEAHPVRIRVPADLQEKQLIHRVLPVYPARAFDRQITGTVLMRVIISQNGSVRNVNYISGPTELELSAMDAVQEWKYKPAILNGQGVEVETTVKMVYSL